MSTSEEAAKRRRMQIEDDLLTAKVTSITSGDSRLLNVLGELTQLCRELDVTQMMHRMLHVITKLVPVAHATIQIMDDHTAQLTPLSRDGSMPACSRHPSLAMECVKTATSVIVDDAASDARIAVEAKQMGTVSLLCVPVMRATDEMLPSTAAHGSVAAVVELVNRRGLSGGQATSFHAEDHALVEVLSSLLSVILSRKALHDDAVRMHSKANALLTCSTELHAGGLPRKKAMRVMQVVCMGLDCERSSMFLLDEAHEQLHLICTDTEVHGITLQLGQGVAGYVISSAETVCIPDAYADARFDKSTDAKTGFHTRNILAVPLLLGSRAMGVLMALNQKSEKKFDQGHIELLTAIALQVADLLLPDLVLDMVSREDSSGHETFRTLREMLRSYYETGHCNPRIFPLELDKHDAVPVPTRSLSPTGSLTVPVCNLFALPDGVTIQHLREWDFDLDSFSLGEKMQLSAVMMQDLGVLEQCSVPELKLGNLLHAISGKYHEHPYHNFTHGVHVLHGCYMLLRQGMPGSKATALSPLEQLCLMVAALGHDVDHPGVNNAFMVATGSPLALLYNDNSVLENHHAATVSKLLAEKDNDILCHVQGEKRRHCRNLILKSILATDMAKHAEMVKDLSDCAAQSRVPEPLEVTQFFLHLADLGNCVVKWDNSKRWAYRVCEEATEQMRREAALGMPVPEQAKTDVYTDPEVAARQLVFLDGWVRPLYRAAAILFPGIKCRLDQIELNRRCCEDEMARVPRNATGQSQ